MDATSLLAVAGVGVAAYLGWRLYAAAGSAAQTVAQVVKTDLNPVNPGNVANRTFEAAQAPLTGEASFSDWLLKKFNPEAYATLNGGARYTEMPSKTDTGDETSRLLARYPAPAPTREPSSVFGGAGSFGEGAGLGDVGFGGLWTGGPAYFTGVPTAGGV